MQFCHVLTYLLLHVFATEMGIANESDESGCHLATAKGQLYNPRANIGAVSLTASSFIKFRDQREDSSFGISFPHPLSHTQTRRHTHLSLLLVFKQLSLFQLLY